jgi:hypothetical protein
MFVFGSSTFGTSSEKVSSLLCFLFFSEPNKPQSAFKKKFQRLSLGKAQQAGWQDEQSRFLSQFVASFAFEMGRWSLPESAMKEFFDLVFERLVLGAKYQTATKT